MKTKLCPNCNKHVAAVNNECPICHTNLTNVPEEVPAFEQSTTEVSEQSVNSSAAMVMPVKKKSKKKIIVVITFIAAVLIAIFATVFVKYNNFSEHEETALAYAKSIKNNLKSPNTFKFYNDILYIKIQFEDDKPTICYFLDYTAANSYGAEVRSQYVFMNGYIYDLAEDSPEPKGHSGKQDTFARVEEALQILSAKKIYNSYIDNGNLDSVDSDIQEWEVISAKKISSKL